MALEKQPVQITQEPARQRRNVRWYMRYLHNKTGFFIVGLVIIYGLSGLLQTYRDTDLLKHDVVHEQKLAPSLAGEQIGSALRIRNFKPTKTEGNIIYFKEGTYNMATGDAKFTSREWYAWLMPFTDLHKSSSRDIAHYFTTLFAVALMFMSVSAFWMFKPGTKLFSSGVYLTIGGIIAAVLLLMLS